MLRVERRTTQGPASDMLALAYDDRKKSRLRARTEKGREVAIVLERGSTLRDGDLLAAESGEILLVRAAPEQVSDVYTADARLLARAAYHLGNRHVPLQIELGSLRYQHDHVLDAMLRELDLEVVVRTAAFEPEPGAYAHGGAAADHTHGPGGHTHPRGDAADSHSHDRSGRTHVHDHEPAGHTQSHRRGSV